MTEKTNARVVVTIEGTPDEVCEAMHAMGRAPRSNINIQFQGPDTPPVKSSDDEPLEAPAEPPTTTLPQSIEERVDEFGVAFNPEYCARAKSPFIKSGPRTGQWKKKKGVNDAAFAEWHAREAAAAADTTSVATTASEKTNTAAAFAPPEASVAPANGVALIEAVAARVNDPNDALTQEIVDAVYMELGLTHSAFFSPPTTADVAAQNVAAVWTRLQNV